MSKESYIRGFCKAAEAHGVDPYALAKFAEGEFSGAVPTPGAVAVGKKNIPRILIPTPEEKATVFGEAYDPVNDAHAAHYAPMMASIIGTYPPNVAALEMGVVDPKYWGAHTTALDRVTAPWRKLVPKNGTEEGYLAKALRDAMIRNYHNEMASLTGTPTRVSAPVKK